MKYIKDILISKHWKLIEACKIILREDGFTNEMIKEEYIFNCNEGRFRIDVVGISKEKTVAFECGNTELRKMVALKKYFDWVIHVPYCHSWLLYPEHYSLWRIYSYACPDTYKLWREIDDKPLKLNTPINQKDENNSSQSFLNKPGNKIYSCFLQL